MVADGAHLAGEYTPPSARLASPRFRRTRTAGYVVAVVATFALAGVLSVAGIPAWLGVVALPLVLLRNRTFDTYLLLSPTDLVVRVAGRERDALPWESIAGFRVYQRRRDPIGGPRGPGVSRAGTPPWLVAAELRDGTEVELWPTSCTVAELTRVRPAANEAARLQAEALAQRLQQRRRECLGHRAVHHRDRTRVALIEERDGHERLAGLFRPAPGPRPKGDPFPDEPVPVEAALEWARSVADVVVLQTGGLRFSAGGIPEPGRPEWVVGTELRAGRFWYEPPGPAVSHFWVHVSGDGSPLDPELGERLARHPDVRELRTPTPATLELAVAQRGELVDVVVHERLSKIIDELQPVHSELELRDGRWTDPSYAYHQSSYSTSTLGPADE